jgi:hypothetical protein
MTGLRHETIAVIWYATVMLRVMGASPKKFAVAIDKTSAELSWALARIRQSRHRDMSHAQPSLLMDIAAIWATLAARTRFLPRISESTLLNYTTLLTWQGDPGYEEPAR